MEDLAELLKVPQEQQRLLDGDRELQDGEALPDRSSDGSGGLILRVRRGMYRLEGVQPGGI